MMKKKIRKPYRKNLRLHPVRNIFLSGKTKPAAQQGKHLTSATVTVAVGFGALDQRNDQRNKEEDQTQPGKQNVEEAQAQISQFHDPQIVVPFLLLLHDCTS